jgi:small GTP-binding protein
MAGSVPLDVVTLGNCSAGKTALLRALAHPEDPFEANYELTLGLSRLSFLATHGGCDYGVSLWDTAGQELYANITKVYVRDKHIVLLCYDRSSEDSFEGLGKWLAFADEAAPDARVVIVATKLDLPDVVGSDRGRQFAAGRPFVQTSALSREGVEGLRKVLLDIAEELPRGQDGKIDLAQKLEQSQKPECKC